jgi:Transposase DDE domain
METILEHAQGLVYSLLCLMPSQYQKQSLEALLGLFLEAQGAPLPQRTPMKSASALSRFLNHYQWSTRGLIRTARQAVLQQITTDRIDAQVPLRVLIDLSTLEKCGKFLHLSSPSGDAAIRDPWVRVLNGKRGLHLVVLYLMVGEWRVPWSFRVWRGKGHPSPAQLGGKLLASVPAALSRGRVVMVQADAEFGTSAFLKAVKQRNWRAVVGMRGNRKLIDGRRLRHLYHTGNRGQQIWIDGIDFPLTLSWFWLKRSGGKRELRFVVSTHPYSGAYLVRLGCYRWAIEDFFKTIKHRFVMHRFGQSTRLGVYRWIRLSWIAYGLAHWFHRWLRPPQLDWKAASDLALSALFPAFIWFRLLKHLYTHADITAQYGFEILLKSLPNWPYRECCKI